jgi:hypothetical protein
MIEGDTSALSAAYGDATTNEQTWLATECSAASLVTSDDPGCQAMAQIQSETQSDPEAASKPETVQAMADSYAALVGKVPAELEADVQTVVEGLTATANGDYEAIPENLLEATSNIQAWFSSSCL